MKGCPKGLEVFHKQKGSLICTKVLWAEGRNRIIDKYSHLVGVSKERKLCADIGRKSGWYSEYCAFRYFDNSVQFDTDPKNIPPIVQEKMEELLPDRNNPKYHDMVYLKFNPQWAKKVDREFERDYKKRGYDSI